MTVKKSEIIENKNWSSIFKPDMLVFDDEIKENNPWINAPKINASIEIQWSVWWWAVYAKWIHEIVDWNNTVDIVWLWELNVVHILTTNASWVPWESTWISDTWTNREPLDTSWYYNYGNNYESASRAIWLVDADNNLRTRADLTFIADWIRLTFVNSDLRAWYTIIWFS